MCPSLRKIYSPPKREKKMFKNQCIDRPQRGVMLINTLMVDVKKKYVQFKKKVCIRNCMNTQ